MLASSSPGADNNTIDCVLWVLNAIVDDDNYYYDGCCCEETKKNKKEKNKEHKNENLTALFTIIAHSLIHTAIMKSKSNCAINIVR